MPSPEKAPVQKYVHTMRNGKPFMDYTPEYKALLREKNKTSDRARSVLWGIVTATLAGTAAIAASYIAPVVPVIAHACTAALSAVAATAGVAAATGVAVVGGVLGLVALAAVGAVAVNAAFKVADAYATAIETGCRPAIILCSAGVTLAAAYGMVVTSAPEQALPENGTASTAFTSACASAKAAALNGVTVLKNAPDCPKIK